MEESWGARANSLQQCRTKGKPTKPCAVKQRPCSIQVQPILKVGTGYFFMSKGCVVKSPKDQTRDEGRYTPPAFLGHHPSVLGEMHGRRFNDTYTKRTRLVAPDKRRRSRLPRATPQLLRGNWKVHHPPGPFERKGGILTLICGQACC